MIKYVFMEMRQNKRECETRKVEQIKWMEEYYLGIEIVPLCHDSGQKTLPLLIVTDQPNPLTKPIVWTLRVYPLTPKKDTSFINHKSKANSLLQGWLYMYSLSPQKTTKK